MIQKSSKDKPINATSHYDGNRNQHHCPPCPTHHHHRSRGARAEFPDEIARSRLLPPHTNQQIRRDTDLTPGTRINTQKQRRHKQSNNTACIHDPIYERKNGGGLSHRAQIARRSGGGGVGDERTESEDGEASGTEERSRRRR